MLEATLHEPNSLLSLQLFVLLFRLKMVVDHLAKPYIKDGLIDEWAKDMAVIAENPNIYCKL